MKPKTKTTKLEVTRYTIRGDDSGHRYFIPVHLSDMFDKWVESFEADGGEYDGIDFDANRIDGHFTFTDPRCN